MMDKAALDRLRSLAGTAPAPEKVEDQSRRNMYQIRDTLMEASELDEEPNEGNKFIGELAKAKAAGNDEFEVDGKTHKVEEADKPDFADIDGDGDEEETTKKAAADKEKAEESIKTEADMMREWANSVYKQYEDRGHYQEPPEGETVDLSLRRYLNADPQKVKIEEDHTEDGMLSEYKRHKGDK
jgi:hypothetical protein